MDWWRIFSGIIIEIGAASFFAFYVLQRSDLRNDDGQEHPAFTQSHYKRGCTRVLNLPLAPGIFATVLFAYLLTIMFLFVPLHPTPNDSFWQFVFSGFILTISIYPPMFVLAVTETVVAVRTQHVNIGTYFMRALFRSLWILIVIEIVIWFGRVVDIEQAA